MMDFSDEEQARHDLAELHRKYKTPEQKPMIGFPPFIEKDGKACHALSHLAADVRNNRRVPDFRGAGWLWG